MKADERLHHFRLLDSDEERRRKAKIPDEVAFKTKPELGVELIERAAGWEVPKAPVLGDAAYGDNTALRERPSAQAASPPDASRSRSGSSSSGWVPASGRRSPFATGPTASR